MSGEVIELSIDETNKLRADLGLAPLRGVVEPQKSSNTNNTNSSGKETLELSVGETNHLRAKLGLKPLRDTSNKVVHKPAENEAASKQLQERLQTEKLKRQVQQGIATTFGTATLADADSKEGALSWAQKMRAGSSADKKSEKDAGKKKKKKKRDKAAKGVTQNYDQEDLEGINVSHAASEFEAGSTTILTLADTSLLKTESDTTSKVVGLNEDDDINQLENVDLAGRQEQKDRLRQKRQVEMGLGHAGGYAGYDDDEFEELGGVGGPSRLARGQDDGEPKKKRRGFQIGGAAEEDDDEESNGLFAFQSGKAMSLEQKQADVAASDFLTAEEDAAMNSKKKKKDAKFKKKKKKKDKKNKRKADDDDEEDDAPKGSILEELEQTAVTHTKKRKRRRDEDDEEAESGEADPSSLMDTSDTKEKDDAAERRARFDEIMEKGNEETKAVFTAIKEIKPLAPSMDEEPDDNFLNEALAKARRMRKLREMSSAKPKVSGADAVAQAVQESKLKEVSAGNNAGGVSFAVDETREFTRALLARRDQEERQKAKKPGKAAKPQVKKEDPVQSSGDVAMEDAEEETHSSNMEELAKQIKEDSGEMGIEGTADSAPVGRGMAGVLSMLRHTGEINGRNAGREEMRGRAKDERTYDDYAPLNLSEVVRIGQGAHERDREFASREIKLDYRDEHGRLLTRKEAYRNLCYHFHGHGSSAKNEERRLRQVEREQAEARVASRQAAGAGSLGALKATQKATGKAFVVHKT